MAVQSALIFDKGITGFSIYDGAYEGGLFEGFLALLLLGALFVALVSLKPKYVMKNRYLKLSITENINN